MGVGSSHEPTSNSCSSSSLVNLRSFRDHSYKDLAGAAGQRGGLGIADDIAIGNTSGGSGMLNTSRDKKKQRLPNFNSFKKRIVKHKKAATAADHSKQFYEYFASKSTSVLSSMLEHYEVLLVLRDLKIQENDCLIDKISKGYVDPIKPSTFWNIN